MPSIWNMFVKKIYEEGKKNIGKTYSFRQALKDASKRKSEMGSSGLKVPTKNKTSKKGSKKRSGKGKKSKTKKSKSKKSKSKKSKSKK